MSKSCESVHNLTLRMTCHIQHHRHRTVVKTKRGFKDGSIKIVIKPKFMSDWDIFFSNHYDHNR